jgi:hypothetical protein
MHSFSATPCHRCQVAALGRTYKYFPHHRMFSSRVWDLLLFGHSYKNKQKKQLRPRTSCSFLCSCSQCWSAPRCHGEPLWFAGKKKAGPV